MFQKISNLTDSQIQYLSSPSIFGIISLIAYLLLRNTFVKFIIDEKLKDSDRTYKTELYIYSLIAAIALGGLIGHASLVDALRYQLFILIIIYSSLISAFKITKRMTKEEMVKYKYDI